MCLLIVVPQCLVLWEELPILITSPPTRLTDPLTLSLDNLLPPDIANKPGWTAVKIQNPEKYLQIFQHNKRYQQKPTSTALYWPRTTKYQLGTAYTDPVPPSTNQYRPILTQHHQVQTSIALYWVSITDPVTPSTNSYEPMLAHLVVLGQCRPFLVCTW